RIGDVFVVRKNQRPLWVAFSLADALAPIATARRTVFEQARDAYNKEVADFTEWKSPAKRAARRAEWEKTARSMPNGGAEFLAAMEKTDPQIEAANTARLGPGGPEETRVKEVEREFREVDALIASLSPDARN